MSQPLPLDEAIKALRRDPTHPVRVRVDEELTVEVRSVAQTARFLTCVNFVLEVGATMVGTNRSHP